MGLTDTQICASKLKALRNWLSALLDIYTVIPFVGGNWWELPIYFDGNSHNHGGNHGIN